MARGGARRANFTAEAAAKKMQWNLSNDASAETVGEWDVKLEQLGKAVLAVLSAGDAIMFGVSVDGNSISVTVYSGERKTRKWVSDSIDLDDTTALILRQSMTIVEG